MSNNILLIEDTDSLREVLTTVLSSEGYLVTSTSSAEEALDIFKTDEFSLVLTDLKLPQKSGIDFIKDSKLINKKVPIVLMTAYGDIPIAVQAMKHGAIDFVTKPFDPVALCNMIAQVIEHHRVIDRNLMLRKRKVQRRLITQDNKLEGILKQALKVASLSTPVLILGESGVGKDMLARFIHEQGIRAEEAFVAVNCGSTPKDLLESEFFGYEPGAFTGASERRIGLFEISSNGSIFLDEIGNMPLELQVKLLRTLQESEIKRVGGNSTIKINSRVISATNSNLESDIKSGKFRADLFYRLSVMVFEIPPLRERKDDIPLLLSYFIKLLAAELKVDLPIISKETLKFLMQYDWPGNVRELENAIERAMIFSPKELLPEAFNLEKTNFEEVFQPSLHDISALATKEAEIKAILTIMQQTKGNKSKAAKILGVSYKTLLNKLKEYVID